MHYISRDIFVAECGMDIINPEVEQDVTRSTNFLTLYVFNLFSHRREARVR